MNFSIGKIFPSEPEGPWCTCSADTLGGGKLAHFLPLLHFLQGQHGLDIDSALQALLLELAAQLVALADIAVEQVIIGMAAAAAEEARPALPALFLVFS
jgi:hypothetical protein